MGRRDILNGAFSAVLSLGGAAVLAGLTGGPFAALLIWGGLGAVILGAFGLGRLFLTVPQAAVIPPPREYISPELTPDVLVAKVDGRTGVQIEAITHTYAGKWLRAEGRVRDIESAFGSTWLLSLRIEDAEHLVYGSFGKKDHERLRALNKGDWITIEGPIQSIRHGVSLDPAELVHIGETPKPPAIKPIQRRGRASAS